MSARIQLPREYVRQLAAETKHRINERITKLQYDYITLADELRLKHNYWVFWRISWFDKWMYWGKLIKCDSIESYETYLRKDGQNWCELLIAKRQKDSSLESCYSASKRCDLMNWMCNATTSPIELDEETYQFLTLSYPIN